MQLSKYFDYKRKKPKIIDKKTMQKIIRGAVFPYSKYGIKNEKIMRGLEKTKP